MDHVVYLDFKAKELANLLNGNKTMILRGAMGRKLPYGKVNPNDILYFVENNGDGIVKARATVSEVFNSPLLTKEESVKLIESYQTKLCLNDGLKKRFGGKRYLVLISVKNIEIPEQFKINRSEYGNMDDWLPVEDINRVKMN